MLARLPTSAPVALLFESEERTVVIKGSPSMTGYVLDMSLHNHCNTYHVHRQSYDQLHPSHPGSLGNCLKDPPMARMRCCVSWWLRKVAAEGGRTPQAQWTHCRQNLSPSNRGRVQSCYVDERRLQPRKPQPQ